MSNARSAPSDEAIARRDAMALLANATREELESAITRNWPSLEVHELKPVETGLVMVRGHMGGDGAPFNLGEATVTRAVVAVGGVHGYAHLLGRDGARARLAATADALWQQDGARAAIARDILGPVAERLRQEKAQTRAKTAATRVDFFTLVRGED